jgi:glycosyltransferase involved in cell wall biosynthesis
MSVNSPYAATIIIPAHNEAAVIGRLLSSLPREIDGRPLQIIVSCNGCTDDTAMIARNSGVAVVEVEIPSKIAALNAADAAASAYPRLYVDADIEITPRAVEDVVRALQRPRALCAATPSRMVLVGRPWLVQAYFAFWRQLMLARDGYVGAGVYALSAAGRGRFPEFPEVIADDAFVRNLFDASERQTVATDPTIVQAPHTVKALFRRRVRVCLGNRQLESRAIAQTNPGRVEVPISWWRIALKKPSLIPQSFVYASFNGLAWIAARRQAKNSGAISWGRDETTRSVPS